MSEVRLIDANELKTIRSIQRADFNSIETIQKWIDSAPTVDAEPIRHGRWELRIVPPVFVCSWCREESDVKYNYCPHCGARMDGQYESD